VADESAEGFTAQAFLFDETGGCLLDALAQSFEASSHVFLLRAKDARNFIVPCFRV